MGFGFFFELSFKFIKKAREKRAKHKKIYINLERPDNSLNGLNLEPQLGEHVAKENQCWC